MTSPRFVITGGGTGGHLFPAIAFAEALTRRGMPKDAIHFVGAERGIEATVVPEHGFGVDLLPGRGFPRRIDLENLKNAAVTLKATNRARRILKRQRPDVVVGFGGYASAPAILAARTLEIPTLIHEQNAVPGAVNRLAVRLGARAAVSWPETPLPGAVVVGNPVREDVLGATWQPADPFSVSVVGGSLGAKTLNDATLELLELWQDRDVVVRHVAGPRNYESVNSATIEIRGRQGTPRLDYRLSAFESDMAGLYATSHVVVARAGASTVAELAVVGTPSVLVPLPGAPGDHQTRNARALSDHEGALLLPDAECSGSSLARALSELMEPSAGDQMHRRALAQGHRGAADDLASMALEMTDV